MAALDTIGGGLMLRVELRARRRKMFTYSPGFVLSNKYFEVILQCKEPKIFNEKVEVLLYEIKKSNKTSTFSVNILGSRHKMMTSKYLFDRKKPGLYVNIFICLISRLVLL